MKFSSELGIGIFDYSNHQNAFFLFRFFFFLSQFVFFTGGIVFLTLIVNGSTTQFVLHFLNMDKLSTPKVRSILIHKMLHIVLLLVYCVLDKHMSGLYELIYSCNPS